MRNKQNTTFELVGVLLIVFAFGLSITLRPLIGKTQSLMSLVLLVLSGYGWMIGGIFTESVSGHPTAWHDVLYIVGFHLVFDLLSIALFVMGWQLRKDARWRRYGWYSLITGLVTLVLIFGPYFFQHGQWIAPIGGLWQRIMEVTALAWDVVMGWRLFGLRRQHELEKAMDAVILFLASDVARQVTGAEYTVNAGSIRFV